jgi:peptidase E
MTEKNIVAGSGGIIFDYPKLRISPILKYALELTSKARPKICLIATATGDDARYIANFYDACANEGLEASHLELFPRPNHEDVEAFILSQDVVWVAGGSVANLLAVWQVHGLDKILKKAWESGVVLTGQSAGSICWSAGGTTDSFGKNLQPVINSIGILPYSSGVHYDAEAQRRPLFHQLIKDKVLPEGYATDDGVSLHFIGDTLHRAVSDRPDKFAYKVYVGMGGTVKEDVIEPTLLQ